MQVHQTAPRDGAPEFLGERRVECAEHLRRQLDVPYADRSAAQIEGRGDERLVHRQSHGTITANARLVAERLRQRLAEADADVLDGMMGIDVEVAVGLDVEVDEAMAREQI